jgi:hypothetical protein
MAKRRSIAQHIAADRASAQFWAFLAALPIWAFALLCAGASVYLVLNEDNPDDRVSAFIVAALVLAFAFFVSIIARWTFSAVRAALTPQRIQAMWLRRFQAEGGNAFQVSRLVDQLARHGVSALTLQDRDVQLSYEQRRNRLAPMFWVLFLPITAVLGYFSFSSWNQTREAAENFRPTADNFGDAIGQAIGNALGTAIVLVLIIAIGLLAFMAATVLIMGLAALAGPVGAIFSRNRDDFAQLPALLQSVSAGKRKGASVLRISDAHWREAVSASLAAADVAIIDLTSVTDNIAWEIGEAVKGRGPESLVFICKDPSGLGVLPQEARASVRQALGRDPRGVIFYPATRGSGKRERERVARDLRNAIYAAFDARPEPA